MTSSSSSISLTKLLTAEEETILDELDAKLVIGALEDVVTIGVTRAEDEVVVAEIPDELTVALALVLAGSEKFPGMVKFPGSV